MTITQLINYQGLAVKDYMNFSVDLTNRSKYTRKDITKEFDSDLWLLSEVLPILLAYKYENEHNAFTNEEMNQWRDIYNNITNSTSYINFK